MPRRFQRKTEDFQCIRCGQTVSGDGYTNHCPRCLWSRHVDVFPGDRDNPCRGMMEPVSLESKGDVSALVHRCVRCGHTGRNRTSPDDSSDSLVRLAAEATAPPEDSEPG